MSISDAITKAKDEGKSLFEYLDEVYNRLPDEESKKEWYYKNFAVLRAAKEVHDERVAREAQEIPINQVIVTDNLPEVVDEI